MENKLLTLTKTFEKEKVRTVWDKDEEKYYISVVDIVSVLTENEYQTARKYWNKLKQRLKEEGNESVTNCHQLKLKSSDGKRYNTDVVDIKGMFRLIESIPSKIKRMQKKSVVEGGLIARNTREQIEEKTGKKIVTSKNNKNIKEIGNKK